MDIRNFTRIGAVLIVSAVLAHCTIAPAGTIYVDAARNGNGSTWANAYRYLQDGLDDANVSGDDIWVAAGTYTPDANSYIPDGTSDRTATFQLINDVALYGGFQSGANPTFNDRYPNTYITILSGDLDANDVPVSDPCDLYNHPNRQGNCYHVVTGSGTDETAILDGFTIKAGNANEPCIYPHNCGAGMYNDNGSPTLNDCNFCDNSAYWGGGIFNGNGSEPNITNCTFTKNFAFDGGGVSDSNSSPNLDNCTFIGNKGGV